MIQQSPALMLIALLGAHCFFDFAGQGDFMSKAKNRNIGTYGIPWWYVLACHATIHGAAAALITGVWWIFLVEAFVHFITDDLKCNDKISFIEDQVIHILCKIVWWLTVFSIT